MGDYQSGQPYYPSPAQPVLPTSTLAVVSLVMGILGFTVLPLLGSIIALITGYMARGETRGNPPRASGDGLATAGIVMGWIVTGLTLVSTVCGLCFFVGTMLLGLFAASTSSSALLVFGAV